jgi:hypothetical protein
MTYVCPAWKLETDNYLLKLQRIKKKVLRNILKFQRCTPLRDLHTPFSQMYVYDYVTKLCRQGAEGLQNHENEHFRLIGQSEASDRKYKRLKFGGDQAYHRSSD